MKHLTLLLLVLTTLLLVHLCYNGSADYPSHLEQARNLIVWHSGGLDPREITWDGETLTVVDHRGTTHRARAGWTPPPKRSYVMLSLCQNIGESIARAEWGAEWSWHVARYQYGVNPKSLAVEPRT